MSEVLTVAQFVVRELVGVLPRGPGHDHPAMSAVWGVVRPRVFALYLDVALVGAVVLGALTNLLLA